VKSEIPAAVLLKFPRGFCRRFLQRCCWRFLQGFAECSYRNLPKVSRWDCWRYLEGFAEGPCIIVAEGFYRGLLKVPTVVLLKALTGVCWSFLQGFAEGTNGGVGEGPYIGVA